MEIEVSRKNKKIRIPAKRVSLFGKFSGLMFRTKNTANLLFEFNKRTGTAIHSFFVFFPFLAVWLDDKNKILEFKIVKPFTAFIKPAKLFNKLLEMPFNEKNMEKINFFVVKSSTRFHPSSVKRKI
ncbi:MAG: hypothetical protein AABX28_02115 [Nanoarchaeota archaeon]